MKDDSVRVIAEVGPRLRALRQRGGASLSQLSATTGISVSTLSRLESGQRKPTLELLLPLARAFDVPLDKIVHYESSADPRVEQKPITRNGVTFIPLTRNPSGLQAFKQILPGRTDASKPKQSVHGGYGWMYVLRGELRLVLGDHNLVLKAGEVAEYDMRVPHAIASAGPKSVEILCLFGPAGERMHLRVKASRS